MLPCSSITSLKCAKTERNMDCKSSPLTLTPASMQGSRQPWYAVNPAYGLPLQGLTGSGSSRYNGILVLCFYSKMLVVSRSPLHGEFLSGLLVALLLGWVPVSAADSQFPKLSAQQLV